MQRRLPLLINEPAPTGQMVGGQAICLRDGWRAGKRVETGSNDGLSRRLAGICVSRQCGEAICRQQMG